MRSRFAYALPLLLLPCLAAAFSSSTAGNQTTFGGFTAAASNVAPYTVSTASDGRVLVSSASRIPLAGGGSFPISVTGAVSRPNAAAAIGRFFLKGSGVIGVLGLGVAAYELAQELGFVVDNSSGATVVQKPIAGACATAPCFEYQATATVGGQSAVGGYQRSREAAATAAIAARFAGIAQQVCVSGQTEKVTSRGELVIARTSNFDWNYIVTYTNCNNGSFYNQTSLLTGSIASRSRAPDTQLTEPATVAEIQAAIQAQNVWNPNSKLGAALREAVRLGDSVAVADPVVSGPASVPGASSVTVDQSTGNTTTVTQTINNNYAGPKVTTTVTTTTAVTNTGTGAPVSQSTKTESPVVDLPVSPETETPPFAMPCGVAGTPPCGVKVDESQTPAEVSEEEYKPMLDKPKQEQAELLDRAKGDADKSFFDGFADLFVTPALATCVPLEIPGDRGTIDPCGTVDGARAIMAYIWALSGLALCLHMVRKAL